MLLAAGPSMQGKFKGSPFAWKKWAGFSPPAEVKLSEFLSICPLSIIILPRTANWKEVVGGISSLLSICPCPNSQAGDSSAITFQTGADAS